MSRDVNNLWAPWRINYLQDLVTAPESKAARGCFLCDAAKAPLEPEAMADRLLLLRDERGMLLLNRYPYTNGHLLVAPLEHVPDISDLSPGARAGLMEVGDVGNRLLKRAMNPQGMNLGMNLGRCAGAGVPGHCHLHVVPRWAGDVNFMDVVGGVRVIPQALEDVYATLREALAGLGGE